MKEKYEHIRRRFSEDLQRQLVGEIDQGKMRVSAVAQEYSVSKNAVYKWLAKHSIHYRRQTRVVMEKQSTESKLKALRARVAELERNVGRKQLEVEYLEKVIETASTELGLDIKKKSGLRSSNGSASTPKNMAGR
jgi:transposase-like protein